jgi:hypothetical protein
MNFMELVLYHGTDEKCVSEITANGFIIKENRRHWLGNGIYFFADEALARWWTTKPTFKFGHDISSPVVLQCVFNAPDEAVLDLRKLGDYTYCRIMFDEFFSLYKRHITIDQIDIARLRCTYFDYLFDIKHYAAIIGAFSSIGQSYYQDIQKSEFTQLGIPYNEVQVCVSVLNQQCIALQRMKVIAVEKGGAIV